MRGDYKRRMEGYAIGRQNGWLSANDIRSLEVLNPQWRRRAQAAGAYDTGQISLTKRRQTSRRTSFFPSSTRSSVLTARMRRFLFEEAVQTLKMKG